MKDRYLFLKAMQTIIENMNNEDAYGEWIILVPDCPTDDDLKEIAKDEDEFKETINLFNDILKRYLRDGFFIGKILY